MVSKRVPYYSIHDKMWILQTKDSKETGDIEYVVSEFIKDNLIFRYEVGGEVWHSHTFSDLLSTILSHYREFSLKGFEEDYSKQELRIIEKLIKKLKNRK